MMVRKVNLASLPALDADELEQKVQQREKVIQLKDTIINQPRHILAIQRKR